jgi:adenine/guanine phosphoribosyltransferase-like PRPP-binding protein
MARTKKYEGAHHTLEFLKPGRLKVYARAAAKILKQIPEKYDTLAFSGISGAIIGPMVASRIGKETLLVRKKSDSDRNSSAVVSGFANCKKYIIIDDFVSTGHTVKYIQREIYKFAPDAECQGVLSVQELNGTGSYYNRKKLEKDYNLTETQLKG